VGTKVPVTAVSYPHFTMAFRFFYTDRQFWYLLSSNMLQMQIVND